MSPDRQTFLMLAAATMATAVGLSLTLLADPRNSLVGPCVVSLLPFFAHVLVRSALRCPVMSLDISTPVLACYGFFFTITGWALSLKVLQPRMFDGVTLRGAADINTALTGASICTTAFVVAFNWSQRARKGGGSCADVLAWDATPVLLGTAYLGLLLIIFANGSLPATAEKYAAHSKDISLASTEQYGWTLWTLTAAPAAWFAAADWFSAKQVRTSRRWLFAVLSGGLAVAAAGLFFSRRDIVVMGIGALIVRRYAGARHINPALAIPLTAAGIVTSVAIVQIRTGNDRQAPSVAELAATNMSHGVLETLGTVIADPERIADEVLSFRRVEQAGIALIPRLFWPGKPVLSSTRLDIVVAQAYGASYQMDTGFPMSVFGEWVVAGGWPLAVVALTLSGIAGGIAHKALVAESASRRRVLIYAALCVWAFYYFKDGDLAMSVVGAGKVVAVTWIATYFETYSRGGAPSRHAFVHDAGIYRRRVSPRHADVRLQRS